MAWLPDDLDVFFAYFEPQLVGSRPVIQAIDGGYRQTDIESLSFNLESDLDFEYTMSLKDSQPVINLQVGSQTQLGNTILMLEAFDKQYSEMAPNSDFN
jgi:hypothetical protein